MTIQVKICGLTNLDDTLDAVELGADYLGFNFYPDSKRFIDPIEAKGILQEVPSSIARIGVFVNADSDLVLDVAGDLNLDYLQFHGDESPEYCNVFGRPWMKAHRLKDESDLKQLAAYESSWLMVDAYVEKAFGGTGVVSNWDLARMAKKYGNLFLSGGLKPENIELAINSVWPYAVDVASGVEDTPGQKNRHKMEEFIMKAKAASMKPRLA